MCNLLLGSIIIRYSFSLSHFCIGLASYRFVVHRLNVWDIQGNMTIDLAGNLVFLGSQCISKWNFDKYIGNWNFDKFIDNRNFDKFVSDQNFDGACVMGKGISSSSNVEIRYDIEITSDCFLWERKNVIESNTSPFRKDYRSSVLFYFSRRYLILRSFRTAFSDLFRSHM